jgi:hypothetical protein
MTLFDQLNLSKSTRNSIEWEMTPDLAFCTFSAKGLRDELTNSSERICYFFIDNWGKSPKLYLMERGVRHVHILAEIAAPLEILYECILAQGRSRTSRDNFPIDSTLKEWLIREIVETKNSPYLIPATEQEFTSEETGKPLPEPGKSTTTLSKVLLPAINDRLNDDAVNTLVKKWNFYDSLQNPKCFFKNQLAAPHSKPVIIDERTTLMWQQGGLDLCSIRTMKQKIDKLNQQNFAGYNDWRLPSLEEALSLMEAKANNKGVNLPLCFSAEQPFIFTAARRHPTGYWFVDYKQAKTYWSSGTVPGGFARLCRKWDVT